MLEYQENESSITGLKAVFISLPLPSHHIMVTHNGSPLWKILNTICHVVVPDSSGFEDLAGVFSAYILRENKKHMYLSSKI